MSASDVPGRQMPRDGGVDHGTAEALPLRSLAEKFLGMMRDERGASEHTLRAYSREVRGFAEFLTEALGEGAAMSSVEHGHIRAYMGLLLEKGLTKASVARALAAIRSWF